eukprot:CAMPEP_0197686206 /NCGR_PEP_ID=MMETSP1338-20131121/102151_2 /TAXON_ID=43686 ORGANISM="Pelagodinium beii, Strain RCC1491" /NCGR_SAMPLE_ID=MMETSP1338 /ASSEMBLY_ACC=CAM_ASM_000754 /LENGTH=69 /DNA_ID=CAMNT_0043268115 /DNA_START=185 /DNA_END=390 /DNA_ORIENTATION=-
MTDGRNDLLCEAVQSTRLVHPVLAAIPSARDEARLCTQLKESGETQMEAASAAILKLSQTAVVTTAISA